jgi:hypothetical protein
MNSLSRRRIRRRLLSLNGRTKFYAAAFADVQRALSNAPEVEPGRLKRSILGPLFPMDGRRRMINPFGLEVMPIPTCCRSSDRFVAAHEWGHLAGYANEAEANFVDGLHVCAPRRWHQYSGWFYLYWQISGEVSAQDRAPINSALADGPRRDVNAVIARLRRGKFPRCSRPAGRSMTST